MKMSVGLLAVFLFLSGLAGQGLTVETDTNDLLNREMEAIQAGRITDDLFLYPVRQKQASSSAVNLVGKISKRLKIEPVLGISYSTAGFELSPTHTPEPVIWISPGIKISNTTYLLAPFANIWIHAWGRIHKHSAFNLNGSKIHQAELYFPYHPYYTSDFSMKAIEPAGGTDFDQGTGGIALMTPNLEIAFGKFRSSAGPSVRSNLGISFNAPPVPQLRIHTRFGEKIHFTYMLGSLYSNIRNEDLWEDIWQDSTGLYEKYPVHSRHFTHHRLDFLLTDRFRIGAYEQVIFGARELAFEYLNPFFPFWSAQHSLGDLDNIQMGLDWEWIRGKFRIFGAFFMDEWAPYSTFSASENHNWFSYQFGSTYATDVPGGRIIVKGEYTWCDPRTYIHRFPINEPMHYGYPIGYWTGGNADDLWFFLQYIFLEKSRVSISYEQTRMGEQDPAAAYQMDGSEFLSGEIKKRNLFLLSMDRILYTRLSAAAQIGWYRTDNIYAKDDFHEFMIQIRYNISAWQ